LLAVDAGFLQKGILITNLDLFRFLNVPYAGRVAFKRDLLEKVRALPGMVSAGEVGTLPLSGGGTENRVWIEGASRASGLDTWFNSISDGYFKAMGIALLAGRDFNVHDTLSSPRVAIVNRSFARDLGLGVYPIGRTKARRLPTDRNNHSRLWAWSRTPSIPACVRNLAPSHFFVPLRTPNPAHTLNWWFVRRCP